MLAYINGTIFDGTKNASVSKKNIIVDGTSIVDILDVDTPLPKDAKVIDCSNKFIIPGLINLHAHLFGSGRPSKVLGGGRLQKKILKFVQTPLGQQYLDHIVKKHVKTMLLSGVTTVRTMGDFVYSDVRVRDLINTGKVLGPRLLVSGPAITCSNGHGANTFAYASDDVDQLADYVKLNIKNKVDLIKICITGGVMDSSVPGEPGVVKMTFDQVKKICDIAHYYGLKVASHTQSTKGIELALNAGVDTIEHGSLLTPELITQIKKQQVSIIVTSSPAVPLARLDSNITKLNEVAYINSGVVLNNMIEGATTALKNQVSVGMGTDASCPFATPDCMWREVVYFQKLCKVSNLEALYFATLGNAKIAGVDKITGSIEKGKNADFLVLEKNPIDDLNNLQSIKYISMGGKLLYHCHLHRNKKLETLLNSIN